MKQEISFADLCRFLLDLGFREVAGPKAIVFDHKPSDILFVFRPYRPDERLASYNLIEVRNMLDARGVMSAEAFEYWIENVAVSAADTKLRDRAGAGSFRIDETRFNSDEYIKARLAGSPTADRGALRTALGYLYKDDGPVNLPRVRLLSAEKHLETAERLVIRWLYTRTNGRLRSAYGIAAMRAARSQRYRCEHCGFDDVRVLNLDHVDGRTAGTPFACLCANCHTIKSRECDWTGERPEGTEVEAP